jgi:hypothetical protein
MRSNAFRRAEVSRPDQNRNSKPRLTSDQSHHGPERFGRSSCTALAGIGPRSRTSETIRSSRSGRSWAIRRMPPQASWRARSMRQRSSGCVATGISDASCPQYSKKRRGA